MYGRYRRMADVRNPIGPGVCTVLCALVLGGCATSHIGSEWPCPASQGTPCTSVSAADPARTPAGGAPAGGRLAGTAHSGASQRPLYRTDGNGGIVRARKSGKSSRSASERCLEGCRPFAWLRRLTGNAPREGEGAASDEGVESTPGDAPENDREANAPPDLPSAGPADLPPAGVPSAGLPPARLRTEEVIGRIWIAPYVDESGVFHEARWVRAVLVPARWMLP